MPFTEDTTLSPLYILGTAVKDQLTHMHGFIPRPSSLFHWSIISVLCQYHTVLITIALQYILGPEK